MTAVSETTCQIVECMLPGVTAQQVRALDRQLRAGTSPSGAVCYLGAVLVTGDEVLFCLFTGPAGEVRAVSERAGVLFERIVTCRAIGLLAPTADPDGTDSDKTGLDSTDLDSTDLDSTDLDDTEATT